MEGAQNSNQERELKESELSSPPLADDQEGKLEYLKREEIGTMERDLATLRESEAKKEGERITKLKTEWQAEKTPETPAESQEEKPVTLIPKAPKAIKSSLWQKVVVRVLIALALLLLLGFLYWFFAVREKPEKPSLPEEEPPITEETPQETPEAVVPPSLITTVGTKTLEVTSQNQVPSKISQLVSGEFEPLGAWRLLIKNTEENKLLGLEEFFQAFGVESPEGFLGKMDNDFTLFVKADETYNSLGLTIKVKNTEGLLSLIQGWEETIPQDTENLFSALGKEGEAIASSFRTSIYKRVGFRYLTISKADFGLCYGWFDDYFAITSSFSAMASAIDGARAREAEGNIGQILIVGFEGKTLTPKFEEMFLEYRPGGVLLLGNNIEDETQLKKLTSDLQELSLRETGLPLLIAVDQEGGPISRIGFAEEKTPQSEIRTTEQAYQIGLGRGQELLELGVNLNLAPLLDSAQEGDFISDRAFQENGEEVGFLAKSLISGQKASGILTAIKHFPGYTGITFNPEDRLPELAEIPDITQFEIAAEAEPEMVMTANVIYEEINPVLPFTFSSQAIQLLKNYLGQNILVISDDLAQDSLSDNFSLQDIMARPVEAGVDLLIFSGWDIETEKGLEAYYQVFRQGDISKEKVDAAVARIINLKNQIKQ